MLSTLLANQIEGKDFSRLAQIKSEGLSLVLVDGNLQSDRANNILLRSDRAITILSSKTGAAIKNIPFSSKIIGFAFCKVENKAAVLLRDSSLQILQYNPVDLLTCYKSVKLLNVGKVEGNGGNVEEALIQIHDGTICIVDSLSCRFYSLNTFNLLFIHSWTCQNIVDMKFRSSDSIVLASGSGLVSILEIATGILLPFIQMQPISAIAIHPSVPDLLCVGCVDGQIFIYDLNAPELPQKIIQTQQTQIWQIKFFANTIWSCSEDGSVVCSDFTTNHVGSRILRFSNPIDSVFGINGFDVDMQMQKLFFVGDSGVVSQGSTAFDSPSFL